MKRFLVVIILLSLSSVAISQRDTFPPPYKRFPEYPPVKLLLPDSVSFYTKEDLPKKLPVLLMMFNPQCEHCQHETEELIKNIDAFKKIQVVMATSMHFDSMLVFREKYRLGDHPKIVVGQDTHFFLFSFFENRNLPFHAFYDKKKLLKKVFEGSVSILSILEMYKD